MFFIKKPTKAVQKSEVELCKEKICLDRADMRKRMAQVEEVSVKLGEVARQTKEDSEQLTSKVTSELKIAKKSLTSFSSRLSEGMLMLDHHGKIVHLNKQGSKILRASEKEVLGKHLSSVIGCGNALHDEAGNVILKPILRETFFVELSKKIFAKIKGSTQKYLVCNEILKTELPFCFEGGIDHAMLVKVTRNDKVIDVYVSLSVLDNDPEDIKDLTYILLFNL